MKRGPGYWKKDKITGRWVWVDREDAGVVMRRERENYRLRGIRVGKKIYDDTPYYKTNRRSGGD